LLGVSAQGLTSDMAKSLGLASTRGAVVDEVTADSPAASAGVHQGDVILGVNGQPISDSNDLRNRISAMAPGSHVELDVQRDGAHQKLTATLSELSANKTSESPALTPKSTEQTLGMTVQGLTPEMARQYRVPAGTTGLIVTDVDESGAAARAGLQPGDVIRQVDGRAVGSSTEFRDALARRTDRPAMLSVQRQGQTFFAAVPRN
jgi:S1-C subfamily serine protease